MKITEAIEKELIAFRILEKQNQEVIRKEYRPGKVDSALRREATARRLVYGQTISALERLKEAALRADQYAAYSETYPQQDTGRD